MDSVTNEFEMNEVCFHSGASVPNLRFAFSTWAENNGIMNVREVNEKCLAILSRIMLSEYDFCEIQNWYCFCKSNLGYANYLPVIKYPILPKGLL